MPRHEFTKNQLITIFDGIIGRTLGEVDKKRVFDRTKNNKKITGIAGDVIEQSVLGYPADSKQEPDLLVDGVDIELKTTGIRKPKKESKHSFEAKEPMSITAVSPERIVSETFEQSKFWHKLDKMLLVYYHYDSDSTVQAKDYADFIIEGYDFHEFTDEEKAILKSDWSIVKNFIQELQANYPDPVLEYPRISSELRPHLMFIDTAPKWPNRPRFRLKRKTVTSMVQEYFGKKLERLDQQFSSYTELDDKLCEFTRRYSGKTVEQLVSELKLDAKKGGVNQDYSKSIGEQIVTGMFGAKSKKLSKIRLFSEIGLTAKTIVQTKQGYRTEDTKLMGINFSEWLDDEIPFENTSLFSYFSSPFLFIIFEESSKKSKLSQNIFKGFKRITFSDDFIEKHVRKVWESVRNLIKNGELKDVIQLKKDGTPIINEKTQTVRSAPNFPKSEDHIVFVRGTGSNSTKKTLIINGVRMYKQQDIWIRGDFINAELKKTDLI